MCIRDRRVALELMGQPEVQARMLSTLGQVHTQLGLYREAQNLHQQALTLRRDLFGDCLLYTSDAADEN